MRFTIKDLKSEVNNINLLLLEQLSCEFAFEQGRNGYQATDAYIIKEDGNVSCKEMIGGGTSREVAGYTKDWYYTDKKKVTTRQQCKRLLILNGYDLNKDFHQISEHSLCDTLVRMAKLTKYRKPAYANGSTARYFYSHLVNKVNLDSNFVL